MAIGEKTAARRGMTLGKLAEALKLGLMAMQKVIADHGNQLKKLNARMDATNDAATKDYNHLNFKIEELTTSVRNDIPKLTHGAKLMSERIGGNYADLGKRINAVNDSLNQLKATVELRGSRLDTRLRDMDKTTADLGSNLSGLKANVETKVAITSSEPNPIGWVVETPEHQRYYRASKEDAVTLALQLVKGRARRCVYYPIHEYKG